VNILRIDSSITGDQSVSRQLTERIVESLRAAHPGATLTCRDLTDQPLPHHRLAHEAESDRSATRAALQEFLAADVVVVGAPMYNFSIPTQLKAWIDAVLVAGKTFAYTENAPQGLAGNKRVIVASSRGGIYSSGPSAAMDHQEAYLAGVFRFIGIDDVEFVRAEGVGMGADARQQAIASALARADTLAGPVTAVAA
jgi:FMN-dependent NADH-azoreductase